MTETPTQLLHRLTSYSPAREWDEPIPDPRLVQGFVSTDYEHFPFFYKEYPADLPRIALPRRLRASPMPLTDTLAGAADVEPSELDLDQLARLLYLSAGVTRTSERRGVRWLFRAAGSAGARFPMELYLAVPDGHAVPGGLHWYDPERHELVRLGPPPVGGSPALVITGVPWRTGWRYRERGYRHIYWDTGTMLSQLLALADSGGIAARLFTRFPDLAVTELVGADGRNEFPVVVVALGDGEPALRPGGPVAEGQFEADRREFPLVIAAQHAGDVDELGDEVARGPAVAAPTGHAATVDETILRRGSMRLMDPAASLPRATLMDAMRLSMRGIEVPHWVAVNAVEGVEPGLYRWPDMDVPVRAGSLRAELYRAALDQGLPRDACFVVISAVDLARVDDRGYREVQLAAGIVEGRLHLMAHALGVAASGMTFQDSDIPALLGAELACLLWTCVGVPEYVSRPGGPPGEPSTVQIINPR